MKENVKQIKKLIEEITSKLEYVQTSKELNELRVLYLSKKGPVNALSSKMRDMSIDEKKEFGRILNDFKTEVNSLFESKKEFISKRELEQKLESEKIDITLPATKLVVGNVHPLIRTVEEIESIFMSMGYDVVEGPEVEDDLYNFEKLNLPKNHPARDAQDTFYITEGEKMLRTQTSDVQARTMDANTEKTPIRMICPGKVYRRDDDDATHSHQFMQLEALVVDKDISVANLKGTLEVVVKKLFGEDREIRLRPSFFPFTEPSFEVDVTCFKCGGKGWQYCSYTCRR